MASRLFVYHCRARSANRQAEFDDCLARNLGNPLIDQVVAMCAPDHPCLNTVRSKKLEWISVEDRPTFSRFRLELNSRAEPEDVSIIAGGDTFFDETLYSRA